MQEPLNKNYGQFLQDLLSIENPEVCFTINNKAFTRATLKDIVPIIDRLISDYPDYIILNIGIPDASTRDIPKWFSDYITYKPQKILSKLLAAFYNIIIKPRRSLFVKLRGSKAWINEKKFQKLYRIVIEYIIKETNAKIIIIPINTPSDRVENQLPGTKINVKKYNKIINKISSDYKLKQIDISDINGEVYYPDGIHYSSEGHKVISRKIAKLISQ